MFETPFREPEVFYTPYIGVYPSHSVLAANDRGLYNGLMTPRGLVSLASSCRYLSQIALDVLWHTLGSPRPLLCTLPADLFAFVPVETVADGERNYGVHKAVRRSRLRLL